MCGICGFTGPSDVKVLKRMADTIAHRGPDDEGFFSDGKINLGNRRLSIIDVKTGRQPIHNEDQSIWLVFNGEIYNFHELREQLVKRGHIFYTDHSDTETVVHLYEEHGSEFVHFLNGMFAIALWDQKKERLLLIRDRMGVKPLFYAILGNRLIFGSEIKAILAHPDYQRNPNFEALYHYFTFKNVPAPMTAFQGIHSLLPGELIQFTDGIIKNKRWWKIRFHEESFDDESNVEKNILSILEDATKRRMISDVPIGAYLSGGVDSSSVVALMTKFTDKPVKTFTLGYEDELKNKDADLFFARKVSQTYGTEHHEYIMSAKELVEDIEKVIEAFDQPFSGTISTYFLSKLIKIHVKVALSGDGADELFGSYLSHRTAQPMHYFARLREIDKSGGLTEAERKMLAPCDTAFLDDLFEKSGGDEVKWRYHLYLSNDEEKDDLLSTEFKSHLRGTTSLALIQKYFENLTSIDPLNRILEMEWNTQLPDQVLAFVDFLSMAHSVEIRSPFLDYRLVEYAATIPGNLKINNGVVKNILKSSVKGLLPEGIVQRPKEGFVLPIFDWMTSSLKDYCLDLLSEKNFREHDFFNYERVSRLAADYHSGMKILAGRVWNLVMFQAWWKKYFV